MLTFEECKKSENYTAMSQFSRNITMNAFFFRVAERFDPLKVFKIIQMTFYFHIFFFQYILGYTFMMSQTLRGKMFMDGLVLCHHKELLF